MKTVALISPNQAVYSETFIHAQITHLSQNMVLYSGGYYPQEVSLNRGNDYQKLLNKRRFLAKDDAFIQSLRSQKVDIVLANYGLTGVQVMYACQRLKIPLIVHFHGFDAYRDDVMKDYAKRYTELFALAKAIIAVSRDMVERLIELGCPAHKVHYIPYGIDPDKFQIGSSADMEFIACGRFVEKKAPLETLRAFKMVHDQLSEARLAMIGDGPLLSEAKAEAKRLGVEDAVEFSGVLNSDEVANKMATGSVFVQHSIRSVDNDSEGTPLAILEASASGLPIVSTRHAGIIDAVEETVTGLLVEEGDTEGMGRAMLELIRDPERMKAMGDAGRKRIIANYSLDRYITDLSVLLD